jgi:hypothetical protein
MISPGEASKVVLTSHVFMSQLMLTYLIVLLGRQPYIQRSVMLT